MVYQIKNLTLKTIRSRKKRKYIEKLLKYRKIEWTDKWTDKMDGQIFINGRTKHEIIILLIHIKLHQKTFLLHKKAIIHDRNYLAFY